MVELPSNDVILRLVDKFFSHQIGLVFPYIYKKRVIDEVAKLSSPGFGGIRRSWLCLLNTIMAFGTALTTDHDSNENNIATADIYLQRALKLLPNVALQPANIEICK